MRHTWLHDMPKRRHRSSGQSVDCWSRPYGHTYVMTARLNSAFIHMSRTSRPVRNLWLPTSTTKPLIITSRSTTSLLSTTMLVRYSPQSSLERSFNAHLVIYGYLLEYLSRTRYLASPSSPNTVSYLVEYLLTANYTNYGWGPIKIMIRENQRRIIRYNPIRGFMWGNTENLPADAQLFERLAELYHTK